jgi:hypothetical protein
MNDLMITVKLNAGRTTTGEAAWEDLKEKGAP